MFTEKCFIRKNNPQLLKDLADLGYNAVNNIVPCFKNNHRTECKYIKCDKDNAESIVSIYDSSMNNWIDDYDLKKFIDCGGVIRDEKVINFQLWYSVDEDHRLEAEKLRKIIALSEE